MPSMVITNVETSTVLELEGGQFRDELLIFAGAGTVKRGTILARVTASGKLTPFVIGGSLGAEIPKVVLTYDVTRAAAGDEPVRAMVKGTVNKNRLIVHADGTGANITNAILDLLRDYGITPVDVANLGDYDTQD